LRRGGRQTGETFAAVDQLFDCEEQASILNDNVTTLGPLPRLRPMPIGS
jgi:hypothetical protein